MSFLLVHSPLVTQQTWAGLLQSLEVAGQQARCVVLDNRIALGGSYYEHHLAAIEAELATFDTAPVVVGHSGAGNLLALLEPSRVAALVFLDAIFPLAASSRFTLFDAPDVVHQWRALAQQHGGALPRSWLAKFGEQILDPVTREHFVASLIDVPLALYDETIPVHEDWPRLHNGLYIQWTDSYAADAARAKQAGFGVQVETGSHFQMLDAPQPLAAMLIAFAGSKTDL